MSKAAPKHRAKREIKRTLKPGARGLVGSRGKALSEFEAEPHSAQCRYAKSGAILRRNKLSRISVGANSVRPCSEFVIISEL